MPTIPPDYSVAAFRASHDPECLSSSLAAHLTAILASAPSTLETIPDVVHGLRGLGHDLRSFDESNTFSIWCANWCAEAQRPSLSVEFHFGGPAPSVLIHWS